MVTAKYALGWRRLLPGLLATAIVAGVGGAAIGVALAPAPAPTTVGATPASVTVPVRSVEYDAAAPASLSIVVGETAPLVAQTSGRVTARACTPGSVVESGSSILSVDDQPLLFLATGRPLWRDLAPGDKGEDVLALQAELARLGQPVQMDGRFGATTLAAIRAVTKAAGVTGTAWAALPAERVVWLPAPSVKVERCTAGLGDTITPGTSIAILPAGIASAALAPAPKDAQGSLVIRVGDTTVRLDAQGRVESPEGLAQLAATSAVQKAVREAGGASGKDAESSGPVSVDVEVALAEPVTALVVPPAALYELNGERACILSGTRAIEVRVLGSELGRTFVTARDGAKVSSVKVRPSRPLSCR